jgi:hypothetical protein
MAGSDAISAGGEVEVSVFGRCCTAHRARSAVEPPNNAGSRQLKVKVFGTATAPIEKTGS